ncbi:MAG: UDP-N-acetylmuramoyl-L-alanyl-D-glutamate--2,6-diaminopimelate ligase [Nitrospirae bacterium]|nr:UDP-N-acetylmuramoyl-L-alanyl-D-glutamate--2,6-diaminopimelate ligase [Nitrospirota bacterium]
MLKLPELIKGIEIKTITGDINIDITSVTCDSRTVSAGTLFVAIKGFQTDGHKYINDVINKGAAALVIEDTYAGPVRNISIPVLTVSDSREAISRIAINYYRTPSNNLKIIGVTGTNGKTTTTHLIKSIMEASGYKTGLIGTVSYSTGNTVASASHTTPEALEFQKLLRDMADNGCRFAVSEVSSHALSLKRVYGTEFEVAVFTNLTQDHLDFHSDMEDYFMAKAALFSGMGTDKRAVINIDDPYGKRLTGMIKCPFFSYGINTDADIKAESINLTMDGIEFDAITPAGIIPIKSGLVGIYNVYNILAAIGAAISCNILPEKIVSGIHSLSSVTGRFEKLDSGMGFYAVVDYAHTENALRLLLEAAAQFTPGRIITVFGCGGDRDRGKRPLMGKAAIELSDYVIVTSDNPRTEDPLKIIEEIETGINDTINAGSQRASAYKIIPDRRSAIGEAVNKAEKGDLVVIAGKGHENYQIVGNKKIHFDDREEALAAMRQSKK